MQLINKRLNSRFLLFFVLNAFIFIFLPSINAQFLNSQFSDSSSSTLKVDPLRKVFGIWGRLLNRMAQPSPPTDDELHLKGLQEGTEENDNFIEESDWTRRIAGAGDGSRKVPATGANRIIDEAKLNQLLPRLNSQSPTTTVSTTTVSTTSTSSKNDSNRAIEEATTVNPKNETKIVPEPELNNKNELINSTILIPKSEEFRKKKTKKNKRKRPTTITIPLLKQAEGVNSEGE
uniref:Uncharacterized protein n=1 Tax=Meloidogyne enterolobii TaxID=390850 RepID=A0A6V7TUW9_MELEN|nr:unnamed protein product [Meloidogyne enterolobii]